MSGSITIQHGTNNSVTKSLDDYPTVSDIRDDANLKAFLGIGDNVDYLVNGASGVEDLRDGDVVSTQTRSNTKGF